MHDDVTAPQNEQEERKEGAITLLDVAITIGENLRILILTPLAAALLALAIGLIVPPTFTASTRILPPSQQQGVSSLIAAQLGSFAALTGGTIGIKNPADQYVALLRSRSVTDAIIQRFNLKEQYHERYIEDTRKELEKRVKITAGVKDGIVSIEVDDYDAKTAAAIANAFVEELRNLSNTLAITEAGQRRLFFESQLKRAKDDLTKSEYELRGSGVSEAAVKAMPQSAIEALARLKAQITAQEIRLASMRASMTDSNPQLKLANQELGALRAELSKLEQTDPGTATRTGSEYIAKYRDFKYHETLFELVAKQYELARLDEAREGATIQVVDAAQTPERKSKPRIGLMIVLSALTAFLISVVFVVVRQSLRAAAAAPYAAAKLASLRERLSLRRFF